MKNLPINWHEGLFLQPHHFQAADRYWAELIHTSERWDHPHNYGLRDISYGFQGTIFLLDQIRARMRDGTLIEREGNDPPLLVELAKALEQNGPVRIYVCVPRLRPREPNVSHDGLAQVTRYTSQICELFDEGISGGNDQGLECRVMNARLMLESDDRNGYESLPIAQVKRSASGVGSPEIDDRYIPPLMASDAWTQLSKGIIRGIHDLLIQRIDELVEMLRDVNIRDHILEVSQAGRLAFLDRLNDLSTTLGVMLPVLGIHPFASYAELCRIVGRISLYREEKRVPSLPFYDHDNLGYVFHEVASLIRIILASIQFNDYLRANFVWRGDIMRADLSAAWFDDRVEWYLGVDRAEAASDADCRKLLSANNNFVWKFGGNDQDIYKLAAVGLKLQETDGTNILPPRQYWSYWKVAKDPPHVYRAVETNNVIAAFVRDKKSHMFQPGQFVETSRFPVLKHSGDQLEFQLALFGVRR
jgi:type VI secretion system protein ImpJ